MKMPKTYLAKILLGAVLVCIAGGISLLLKDALDTKSPTSAVPILTVESNGSPISQDSICTAEYQWNFWTSVEKMVNNYSITDIKDDILTTNVLPGMEMELHFSRDPISVTVSRAVSLDSNEFTEVEPDKNGCIYTPPVAGTYIYRVEASFDRGSVMYYFGITVMDMY